MTNRLEELSPITWISNVKDYYDHLLKHNDNHESLLQAEEDNVSSLIESLSKSKPPTLASIPSVVSNEAEALGSLIVDVIKSLYYRLSTPYRILLLFIIGMAALSFILAVPTLFSVSRAALIYIKNNPEILLL